MENIYTIKCYECGTETEENQITLIAEDAGYCNECFHTSHTRCDYCKEFSSNKTINEVEVGEELYDLCPYCYENQDWDTLNTSTSNLNEYYYPEDDYDEPEEEEEEFETPQTGLGESAQTIYSEDLDEEEGEINTPLVEDFYNDLVNK